MLDPKIKRDWYQTETHVIVSIFVKNLEDVKVAPTETTVSKNNLINDFIYYIFF